MDHEQRALPDGWELKRLGDVVDILDGKRIPIKEDERDKRITDKPVPELIPYYGATGQVGWIDEYIFNEELVLLGEDGAPFFDTMKNKAYIINGKSWVNNHAHVLKAKSGVALNLFICNYLNVFEYNGYVSGTTRTKLIQSEMRRIPIPLPPLPTQCRIVSILEKAEETKRLRVQADELTDRLLQSVFLEMFGNPVRNPKGWEIKTMNEICERITDGEHITPQRTNEGIYLLSARNIQNHKIALDDVDFIDEEEYQRISRRIRPQKGDILISCSGTIGRVARVKDNFKFQLVRSVALVRPIIAYSHPIYLEYIFTTNLMKNQIKKAVNQSSQANLFQGKIRKLFLLSFPA